MLSSVFKFCLPEISSSSILKDLVRSFEISAPRPLHHTPPWDLDKVLEYLSGPPFEPLAEASFWNQSRKALFLLAMATAKRIGELQALSKPFPQKDLNDDRRIFNYRLSRARRVVENAFGILSARFRIFHSTINLKLDSIEKVVLATIALHNYLRRRTVTTHNIINNDCNDMMPNNNSDENCMASLERGRDARVASQIARNVRDKFDIFHRRRCYCISRECSVNM